MFLTTLVHFVISAISSRSFHSVVQIAAFLSTLLSSLNFSDFLKLEIISFIEDHTQRVPNFSDYWALLKSYLQSASLHWPSQSVVYDCTLHSCAFQLIVFIPGYRRFISENQIILFIFLQAHPGSACSHGWNLQVCLLVLITFLWLRSNFGLSFHLSPRLDFQGFPYFLWVDGQAGLCSKAGPSAWQLQPAFIVTPSPFFYI